MLVLAFLMLLFENKRIVFWFILKVFFLGFLLLSVLVKENAGNGFRRALGPILASGHWKYQSKIVLERPFWRALQKTEMASGGPQGRSWPPAIESIRAKLYWSDHFGEPFKKRINNFAKCGYKAKNPKCILVLRFLFLVFGFFCLLGFHITRVLQGNRRKWPPEGPRADLGLRPLKVSKQNCIGATILESPPKSTILESPPKINNSVKCG